MIKYLCISLLIFVVSCTHTTEKTETLNYFNSQIEQRKKALDTLVVAGDSMKLTVNAIDRQIMDFILLSKDIENLNASVNKGNAYFKEMASTYDLKQSDFILLSGNMHVDEIELVLKQNELNFLNQILFLNHLDSNTMYTAH